MSKLTPVQTQKVVNMGLSLATLHTLPPDICVKFMVKYGKRLKRRDTFNAWYQRQRGKRDAGTLPFEPPYPHEVGRMIGVDAHGII